MMKKRFWALFLAIMMVVSVLPTTAFAADAAGSAELEPGDIRATKSLVLDENGEPVVDKDGYYTIQLAVQGAPVQTDKAVDVILCIDVSNSMTGEDDKQDGYVVKPGEACGGRIQEQGEWVWIRTGWFTGYYDWVETGWKCGRCGETWDMSDGDPGNRHNVETAGVTRLDIAKDAAEHFTTELLGTDLDIRMAVVAFGGKNGGLNDRYLASTALTDDSDTIVSFVEDLQTPEQTKDNSDGGTNYTSALGKASDLFKTSTGRDKFVLFLSDGKPAYTSDQSNNTNWNGINQADDLKKDGVTIYSGGIAIDDSDSAPLKAIASTKNGNVLYQAISKDNMAADLKNLMNIVKEDAFIAAGRNAVMVDVVNTAAFEMDVETSEKVVEDDGEVTWKIGDITSEIQTIEIKVKPRTGVYGKAIATNESCVLTYIDPENQTKEISCESPTVDIPAPVSYEIQGDGPDVDEYKLPGAVSYLEGDTVPVEPDLSDVKTEDGTWVFQGWTTKDAEVADGVFTMPAKAVKFVGTWKLAIDIGELDPVYAAYQIEHYLEQEDGTYTLKDTDLPAGFAIVGTIASVKATDYNEYSGYAFDSGADNILSKEVIKPSDTDGKLSITTLKIYYAIDNLDDEGDKPTGGDKIPDKYQTTVTFKVVNGSWNDETEDDKTIVVTLTDGDGKWAENGTYTLGEDDVPTAGEKPADGYAKGGTWAKLSDNRTTPVGEVIVKDVTYTFNYGKPIEKLDVYAVYQIEHYLEQEDGSYALKETDLPAGSGLVGNKAVVKETDYNTYEGYAFDKDNVNNVLEAVITKPSVDQNKELTLTTLKIYYSIDVIGGQEGGDEIPDKYQITVEYKSNDENMGAVSNESEVITLIDENDKWLEHKENVQADKGSTATANTDYGLYQWVDESGKKQSEDKTFKPVIAKAEGGETYIYTATFAPVKKPITPVVAVYKVEHYKQNEVGGEYELVSADTEFPKYEEIGEIVTATPKNYGKNYAVNAQKSKLSGKVVNVTKNEATGEPEYLVLKVYYDMLKPADLKVEKVIHSIVDKDGNAKELVYDENGKLTTMAAIGDKITWAAIVSNLGETPITISITDTLVINGVAQEPANVKVWGNTSITLGGGATNTYLYPIYSYTVKNGDKEIINAITVSGTEDGEPKGTDEAPGVTVEQPSVSIEKKADKTSVKVGDKVTYTITVKNTGNVDLTNVKITDTFLDGGKGAKKTEGTWSVDTLKPGDSIEAKLVYTTVSDDISGLKNSAVVETEETGDNDTAEEVEVNPVPVKPVGPSKPKLNKEDHYAYIVGYPDGLVHPEKNITRAEVSTIFFRMLLDESREDFWSQENWYSDVVNTDWFNNAVSTLSNAGLINGYPDGSFKPNANITRAEFATIAIRFFLEEDVEINENNLSDVKGHWAEANINLAYALNLINGYPDGTFRPDQLITRAEAMTIVNRVLERDPHKDHLLDDMIEWPDNMDKDIWYYAAVQEATNSHEFYRDAEEKHEIWTELLPVRDWAALEREWSQANSSKNPGEVVDINISTPEASDDNLKLN